MKKRKNKKRRKKRKKKRKMIYGKYLTKAWKVLEILVIKRIFVVLIFQFFYAHCNRVQ